VSLKRKLARSRGRPKPRFPVATLCFYGPDDQRASKISVGIVLEEGAEPVAVERWFSTDDVRRDREIGEAVAAFVKSHQVRTVVTTERIIGCPHEEGIDYPEGQACPQCPFWAIRDRFTGEIIH
jgi:hypothetical protein